MPSFAEPLGLWVSTRMPAPLFGALVLLLVGAAWALAAGATALLLVFQFRLWDDLADAPLDRVAHPERHLPRSESAAPFHAALAVTGGVSLLAVFFLSGAAAAAGLLGANALFAAWYRRTPEKRKRIPGTLLLLAKYPVFVLLLAPAPRDPVLLALACAAVYAVACLYEWRTS